ncbi:uncharacterized protein J8A68_002074 [[Candida] subhashii]|uniref:CFEM domain-containing protein n=1 Tax=[Candida] subhashii TaxID=561895 RepID=A0A8J5QGU5_9ASCO|nr:uncharacterized protein J8A68_002074 [[Candida] subhashii]KAG7664401.1 hypothetical protein J8A68_002074 [[Candida] subhashii]
MKSFTVASLAIALMALDAAVAEDDNPYTNYPPVPKTATINGFADRIYDNVAECAKGCLEKFKSTGSTPCPYWDTGCLCMMPQFGGPIGACIAEECQGGAVQTATSLAYSACSVAGVPSSYWFIPTTVKESLDAAATEEPSPTAEPEAETSTTDEPSSTSEPEDKSSTITTAPETTMTSTSTRPAVIRTASINGFADRIYEDVPECAKECLENQGTGNTPCPYWDTGCLCVMPQFAGPIGECIANGCKGKEVQSATSLAYSACSVAGVGAPYWMIPETVKESLDAAATEEPSSTADPEDEISATDEASSTADLEDEISTTDEASSTTDPTDESSEAPTTDPINESSEVPTTAPIVPTNSTSSNPVDPTSSIIDPEQTDSNSEVPNEESSSAIWGTNATSVIPTWTNIETVTKSAIITLTTTVCETNRNGSSSTTTKTLTLTEYSEVCDKVSCKAEHSSEISIITSCESAIKSIESAKSEAEKYHQSAVVTSCESAIQSISSVEQGAKVTLTSLLGPQEGATSTFHSLETAQPSDHTVEEFANDASSKRNLSTGIVGFLVLITFGIFV